MSFQIELYYQYNDVVQIQVVVVVLELQVGLLLEELLGVL